MKKVYLHGENNRDVKEIEVAANADHNLLLELFKREFQIAEHVDDYTLFFQEDEIFPDGTEVKLEVEIIHRGHYHVHRCKKIKTEVTYNGQTEDFEFVPSATGNKVLKTVISKFKIAPADATDLLLKVNDEIIFKATDHIGSFVGHHDCKLSLLLVSDKLIQG
ncbi:hypothetical protein [Mucilaginibacter sp.]|jgi:hypothetical protein|uniref:hypothetical protein n=1 Tax=Mucilaginibacter sp. TaxID=1882438 RepID=UPI00356AF81B